MLNVRKLINMQMFGCSLILPETHDHVFEWSPNMKEYSNIEHWKGVK